MGFKSAPQHLSHALSQVVALRGLARTQGSAQLAAAWAKVAGPEFAPQTRVISVRRGVLHVSVASAPLLSELAGFHREIFLDRLRQNHADLRVRDIRFRLAGAMNQP